MGEWSPSFKLFWELKVLTNITAHFITPSQNQEFTQGEKIRWNIIYNGFLASQSLSWWEFGDINSNLLKTGRQPIIAGYGTNQSVEVVIKGPIKPTQLVCYSELEGRTLPATSGNISEEMHLPLWIDTYSGIFKQRLNNQVQHNKQDDIYTHPTSFPDFFKELTTPAETIYNINNPWIDPKTGKYWNMSITFGAFNQGAKERDLERYYMNMRWIYGQSKKWWLGKKIWIKNPATRKAIVTGVLDWGPLETTGSVAGASPEALRAIGAQQDSIVEFCWADQDSSYGGVVGY